MNHNYPQNHDMDHEFNFLSTRTGWEEGVDYPIVWNKTKDVDVGQDFGDLEDLYVHEQHDDEMAEEAFSQNDIFEDLLDPGTGPINQEQQEHFN